MGVVIKVEEIAAVFRNCCLGVREKNKLFNNLEEKLEKL